MMRAVVLSLGLPSSIPAWGVDTSVCYNYSCASQAKVDFSSLQMRKLRQLFKTATTPDAERSAIANAIGLFGRFAGEQTPTWRDKGGNINDNETDGRMDCSTRQEYAVDSWFYDNGQPTTIPPLHDWLSGASPDV